eukprot:GHVN01032216.1.p1 GENE.GHVN01032216.1~~GHVN01032216.1.p1  ORF type:complete len:146 (+),score=27.32 GHVN01032216.1:762-1199(+)
MGWAARMASAELFDSFPSVSLLSILRSSYSAVLSTEAGESPMSTLVREIKATGMVGSGAMGEGPGGVAAAEPFIVNQDSPISEGMYTTTPPHLPNSVLQTAIKPGVVPNLRSSRVTRKKHTLSPSPQLSSLPHVYVDSVGGVQIG